MTNELLIDPSEIELTGETTTVKTELFRQTYFVCEGSPSIGKLIAALSAAQSEMEPAVKDSTNPHFRSKYADLASIWDACRKPLTRHGMAVLQPVSAEGAKVTVRTILAHCSGEWIASALTIQAQQNTPQGVGSAITYGRRYGLAAMVGIAPDDDDGESAEGRGALHAGRLAEPVRIDDPILSPPIVASALPPTATTREARISEAQAKRFYAIAKGARWPDDDLLNWLQEVWGFSKSIDITRNKYNAICEEVAKGPVVMP